MKGPKKNLADFLKSGSYLPRPLRDFHDAKEFFKTMHGAVNPENESIKPVNWIAGHCYVIDIFLWWAAKHGWTLQRSRQNVEFEDLEGNIEKERQKRVEEFHRFLEERKKESVDSGPSI